MLIEIKLLLILLNTWIFDLFWIGSKMTVKTQKIRQKEPKGERTFGADCTSYRIVYLDARLGALNFRTLKECILVSRHAIR